MACLSEPLNRPLQEFAYGGRLNPKDPCNFAIAKSGSAKMQALALLLGKPFDLAMQAGEPLALEKCLFGSGAGIHERFVEFGSPPAELAFPDTQIQPEIVRHAIQPGPLVFDAFASSKAREKAPPVVRATNARIQLRSYRSRAYRPGGPNCVVIDYLGGL